MFSVIENSLESPESGKNSKTWNIPLVDFHTHIGKVAIETTKGSSQRINRPQDIIDLYEKLKFELFSRFESDPNKYYITIPVLDDFVKPLFPLVKYTIYKDLNLKGWIADQIVSFPFNDIFHKKTNPKFVKSNEYVRHSVNKFDFTFRFVPFCRVDATEDKASDEVINSAKLGAKGLKLHPLSQNWIDKIVTPECKKVLQTAGKLKLPIIFDVPNKGVAKDITEVAAQARSEVDYPINVVLGHTGFDYSSPEIFDYISQEGMVTETSGMRGSDVELFFKNVSKKVPHWYDKIVYGTDSNYFTVLQAADFISFLFSNDFKELVSEVETTLHPLEIASKILGLNSLNLLPLNYENRPELNYKINNDFKTESFQIKQTDLVNSLKKLLQKKESFYNVALKPVNGTVEYALYVINDNEFNSLMIKDLDENKSDLILKPTHVSPETDLETKLTLEAYQNFCTNENNNENNHSNKEKMKPVTTLEELF